MTPRVAALCSVLGLQPRQAEIVLAMYDAGSTFSRWDSFIARGLAKTQNNLSVQINYIRAQLGKDVIEAEKPNGYRLSEVGRGHVRRAFHVAAGDLMSELGLRISRGPAIRGVDLWIDGKAYQVDPAVKAHFRFVSDMLSNMATQAARYFAELQSAKRGRVA